ncbi:MAG TPA: hypothetical protein PLZ75_02205 [Bacteroidales bacterium]|jgi:hypothetical protein|nr:hypothetical protein [Bacteroidales bacterium]HQH24103.1 hypothetical protein [Bacteroidales bacterium]HQJ83433.1 hypothetical protein [Bacteroidales bacterium]
MDIPFQVPEPFLFSPLKHYFPYIRAYSEKKAAVERYPGSPEFIRELRQIGSCVMDVYRGELTADRIFSEISNFLISRGISRKEAYAAWTGKSFSSYRKINLADSSEWILKYNDDDTRYVHLFPSRSGPFTFRVKASTLRSALLYQILIGKDYITGEDLNRARFPAGLPPVKSIEDAGAITEMIEMLRD